MDLKRLDEKLDKLLEMGATTKADVANMEKHLLAVSANSKSTDAKLSTHMLDDQAHGAKLLHRWGALGLAFASLLAHARGLFHGAGPGLGK